MALGEYRPPNQITKDEDKYWKLTKTQIIYVLVGLMLGAAVLKLLSSFHVGFLTLLGVVILAIFVVAGAALGGITIMDKYYLRGGGLRLDQYLWRRIKKKFPSKRQLYTNNINRDKNPFIKEQTQKSPLENLIDLFSKNGGNE